MAECVRERPKQKKKKNKVKKETETEQSAEASPSKLEELEDSKGEVNESINEQIANVEENDKSIESTNEKTLQIDKENKRQEENLEAENIITTDVSNGSELSNQDVEQSCPQVVGDVSNDVNNVLKLESEVNETANSPLAESSGTSKNPEISSQYVEQSTPQAVSDISGVGVGNSGTINSAEISSPYVEESSLQAVCDVFDDLNTSGNVALGSVSEFKETVTSPFAESSAPPLSIESEDTGEIGRLRDSEDVHPINQLAEARPSVRPRTCVITAKPQTPTQTRTYEETHSREERIEKCLDPFTEEQLSHFYHNQELQQVDYFVDEFLRNSYKEKHEFYELVQSYYKARKRLGEILDRMQSLQDELKGERENAWVITQETYVAEGNCDCNVKVVQKQNYKQAFFQENVKKSMSSTLFTVRGIAHETLPLELYQSQVAKLRIENYLSKLFKLSPMLLNLTSAVQVSASLPANMDPNLIQVLVQMQDCITVLFVFKRYGVLEVQFSNDIDAWLETLVATLQRIGTLPDTFFLLNHLLRCPPSTVVKMSHFVQFPFFASYNAINKWNSPLVHHFIVMLATLTLPVRSREEFLTKYGSNVLKSEENKISRSISWTLVDEEKEEDERLEDSWSLMTESDLIAVFDQFPFANLLIYLLSIEKREDDLAYCPSRSCSNDMMCLFALSSCLINLLSNIFDTYNLLRYRQFLKCVSRIIRLVTQVVSDHWLSYRNYRIDIVGDTMKSFPADASQHIPQFTLERLQVEFDQLFLKATKRILSSHSAGAIQFLSTMPFEAVQSRTMWVALFLALDHRYELDVLFKSAGPDSIPSAKSLDISPSEGIFLLTALSNMAIARNSEEDIKLVEAITVLVVEISFLNTSLNGLYAKNGKDFLDTICHKHPLTVTALLDFVLLEKEALRNVITYIFDLLPLSNWIPTISDLEKLRKCLLSAPLNSEENKMARIIFNNMNYGTEQNSTQLFLPRSYHYAIGIMMVEAYGLAFPDYPGGIIKLDNKDTNFITQVGKFAVASFTKLMQSKVHAEHLAWGWEVLLKLRLHESDAPHESEDNEKVTMLDEALRNAPTSDTWCVNTIKALRNKRPFEFHLEETPQLLNVNLALKTNGLYANYLAFCMTKDGHFADLVLNKGLHYINTLKDWYQYDAVLKMFNAIVPIFLNTPEKLTCESFVQTLNKLIHVDVDKAGYTEKIWQYFIAGMYSQRLSAMITSQILQAKKHSVGKAHRYVAFWIFVFLKIPMWHRDCGVLFQIDRLCKVAFTVADGLAIIEDELYDQYKKFIKSQEPRGLLSSVMSWISANQNLSLMSNVSVDFCFYAYVILRVEKRFQDEIGLWKEMSTEMISNPMISVEDAYKKSMSCIKSLYIPPMTSLSIYRWGEQAIATPNDHPFLPIIWQQFFLLFLRKPEQESGLPSRTGIGMRFFNSTLLSSFAKKMKNNLQESASYHQDKSNVEENASSNKTGDKEYQYTIEFHIELANLYQGLALWLEESRLHDATLYIDSLPDVYIPRLLLKVFQGNQDSWYDYVSAETLNSDLRNISLIWRPSSNSNILGLNEERGGVNNHVTSRKRITKRLSSESPPRSPPDVVRPKSPVEEISLHVILTQPRLFQEIHQDLNQIVEYSKRSSSLQASHVGLDNEFLEMLPDLYEMATTQLYLHIPCEGKVRKGGCKGPYKVIIKYDELRLRERVARLLDDNRSAFEQLLQNCREAFPYDLCINTVHVENIIEKLSDVYQTIDHARQTEIQQSARKLFYLLAELINDDVKRCYPAIQFFSSGVEVLGKVYIADNPSEQMPLLETIVNHTSSVMFLAPHFCPMGCSVDHFVELYSKLVSYIDDEIVTVIFVLLSKFDVNIWLSQNPSKQCVANLLTNVIEAAGKIGREPNTEGFVVLELVRNHLVTLLKSDLNAYYSVVLAEVLTMSASAGISILIWEDFLAALDFHENIDYDAQFSLAMDQATESVHYMASFFMSNCQSMNNELETVYKIWEPYVKSVCILLKNLLSRLITHSLKHRGERRKDVVLKELWEFSLSVFHPWLVPQSTGKIWTLLRAENVQRMVHEFTETVKLIVYLSSHDNDGYCFILNDLLTFYGATVIANVKEQQSLDIFHSSFVMLPWQQYCPSIQELMYATQIYGVAENTFNFYSSVFLQVNWSTICMSYSNSGNPSAFNQVLLHIVLMMTTSSAVVKSSQPQLKNMLQTLLENKWDSLVLEDTYRVCHWYSNNVESSLLLLTDSIVWSTLKFIKHVCGFVTSDTSSTDIVIAKRNIYIQVVATLISRSSSLENHFHQFQLIMAKLLSDVDSVLGYNHINPMEELVTHCSTCLSIQNNITGPVSNAIKSAINSHLLSTSCSMAVLAFISSASRCLANIHDMVELLESAISCHFIRLTNQDLSNSWLPIVQCFVIPELSKEDFVTEAIKQTAFLTLYSFNLTRMSRVTSHVERLDIMIDAVSWCSKPKLDKDSEAKILLLWLQIFDIISIQSAQNELNAEQWKLVAKQMMFLSAYTQNLGEDKSYSGVLGMIGIGRRSGLSKEFRLTAKALNLFLLSQLPSSLIPIRNKPDSPGAIRNPTNKTGRATMEAEKAFIAFKVLLKNNNYQNTREEIQWVIDLISNPNTNINDGCSLVSYCSKHFFFKQNFIAGSIS